MGLPKPPESLNSSCNLIPVYYHACRPSAAFLRVDRRTITRKATLAKAARKPGAIRADGDTGTPEMKQRQRVVLEARQRSSTGQPTMIGARVEAQFPHDRYKQRNQLDPTNAWRNERLWDAAERLRQDFDMSGMAPRTCVSFTPRVTGGNQTWQADIRADAEKRYKKAMAAIGPTLRSVLFWICITGEYASDWAVRNVMDPKRGICVLRLALAELAHHYGYVKLPDAAQT